jgi:predicted enzyme related to lactoylglutathione lyase
VAILCAATVWPGASLLTPRCQQGRRKMPASSLPVQKQAMLLGLRTALYPMPDLACAKAWYAELLGLLPDGQPGSAGPQPLWGVADIGAAHARLLALGATALEPAIEVSEDIRVAAVLDPFGNRLGLIQSPRFSPAQVR